MIWENTLKLEKEIEDFKSVTVKFSVHDDILPLKNIDKLNNLRIKMDKRYFGSNVIRKTLGNGFSAREFPKAIQCELYPGPEIDPYIEMKIDNDKMVLMSVISEVGKSVGCCGSNKLEDETKEAKKNELNARLKDGSVK